MSHPIEQDDFEHSYPYIIFQYNIKKGGGAHAK
jgi:hypothetical protein